MAVDVNNNNNNNNSEENCSSSSDNNNECIMNNNIEVAQETVITCTDIEDEAVEMDYSITINDADHAVDVVHETTFPEVQIVRVRHIDDGIGTSNLAYAYDSIEILPVLADLDEQCRHRYSVVIDNIDTSDEDQDFNETLGPVTPHRTCSCHCHENEQALPSYEHVIMNMIQHSDLILHDDINCNGETCNSSAPTYRTHSRHRLQFVDSTQNSSRNSPNGTPGNTPGRTRRMTSKVARILNTSATSSPVLGKEPPNYRSLIFSIIKDEPPKYEEVTGKKLADELIPSTVVRRRTGSSNTIKQRICMIGTFVIAIIITIVLMYMSAAVLDSTVFPSDSKKSGKSSKADSNLTS